MNRLKIGFILTSVIILAISLIIGFSLKFDFTTNGKIAYFSVKIIVSLIFIVSILFTLISKEKTGTGATLIILSLALLFVPLIVRFMVKSHVDHRILYAWIVILVSLAIYIFLGFGLSFQDKLMGERDKITESNEIPVQSEKRLATDEDKENK